MDMKKLKRQRKEWKKNKKHVLKLTFAFAFASPSEPETQIQAQGEKRRFHRFYATTRWRQRLSPFRKKDLWRVRKRRPLIRPFLRPTAKCFAILGSAIIAKVSTDILKSHWDPHILWKLTLFKCPQLCLWIVSARDLPVSVKDCKTSPAITRRRVGEVEENPLPVISHNKMHKTSKFLFTLSSYFLQLTNINLSCFCQVPG